MVTTILIILIVALPVFAAIESIDSDDNIVAACIILEAGGEGEVGMRAVMNVIQNRSKSRNISFKDVVLQNKQFSCFNSGVKLSVLRAKKHPSFKAALEIVELANQNRLDDITHGADHYFNPDKCFPRWAKEMRLTNRIGNHDFYKSI